MFKLRIFALLCVLLTGGLSAQLDFGPGGFGTAGLAGAPSSYVQTTAQCSVDSYKKGESFYIALRGEIEKGWHAYFRNPGTVGMPMSATMEAPEGFAVEGPYWSVPEREESPVGISYAYVSPTVVWKVTPTGQAPQEAEFTVSSTTQVCSDTGCSEPQTQSVTIGVREGDGAPSADWRGEEKLVEHLGDTPTTLSATQTPGCVTLHFTSAEPVGQACFFSEDNSISPTAEQVLEKTGDNAYSLTLPRNDNSDTMYPVQDPEGVGKPLDKLRGILSFGGRHSVVDVVPEPPVPLAVAGGEAGAALPMGFWGIAGSLFLGGLILNLMPCVFPVIGLKIMSFVELGGGSRRKVLLHSFAFVLGILVSFWLLSLMLVVLSNIDLFMQQPWTEWAGIIWNDSGSDTRNWAVWMQNPWVVYGIMLLLLVLGLSMFGLFEIGVGATAAGQGLQKRKGLGGSFFQGLLVTVVATPCSAPFLGAALPAAMAMPGIAMMAALTFMALGLASPYILLGAFPSLVRCLPRPGAWMESLKQGLSFLLFAAAAWMLDVYLASLPPAMSYSAVWIFISLVAICCAFWVYGRWCPLYRSMKTRVSGLLAALALLVAGVWGSMPVSEEQAAALPEWREWSEQAMQEELDAGNPVYVDFTAKWCATCQSNKKTAYTQEVYEAFRNGGVVLMRADKTRPNPAIDAAMRKIGRSSVPANALYVPDEKPAVTTELLTPGYLLEFLGEHLDE